MLSALHTWKYLGVHYYRFTLHISQVFHDMRVSWMNFLRFLTYLGYHVLISTLTSVGGHSHILQLEQYAPVGNLSVSSHSNVEKSGCLQTASGFKSLEIHFPDSLFLPFSVVSRAETIFNYISVEAPYMPSALQKKQIELVKALAHWLYCCLQNDGRLGPCGYFFDISNHRLSLARHGQ